MTENKDVRLALVTGASRGIGKATAIRLAQEGYHIILNYRIDSDACMAVKEMIENQGGSAEVYQADVSNETEIKNLFKMIKNEYGKLDVLINNAGLTRDNLIMRISDDDFNHVFETNVLGAFHCMREAVRLMVRQRSGRIINLSSIVGTNGNAGQVNYAASKAALNGMTKSLAKEVGSRGITVNSIAPGFIQSEMTEVLNEEYIDQIKSNIPLGRLGTVEDVAELIAFLVNDRAGYITGQVIKIDGGLTI